MGMYLPNLRLESEHLCPFFTAVYGHSAQWIGRSLQPAYWQRNGDLLVLCDVIPDSAQKPIARMTWFVFIPLFVTFRTLSLGNAIILQDPHKKCGYFSSRIKNDSKSSIILDWEKTVLHRSDCTRKCILIHGRRSHRMSKDRTELNLAVSEPKATFTRFVLCPVRSCRACGPLENTSAFPTTIL